MQNKATVRPFFMCGIGKGFFVCLLVCVCVFWWGVLNDKSIENAIIYCLQERKISITFLGKQVVVI